MVPLVAVCISNYNRCQQLKKAIGSILWQDYPNYQVVIYDNCSTDGSPEYLQDLNRLYPDKIHIVLNEAPDKNAMRTLNCTFNLAKDALLAKYVLVMDDDSYLDSSDTITELVKTAESDYTIAIVGANVKSPDGTNQLRFKNLSGEQLTSNEINNLELITTWEYHGSCALYNVDIVSQLGWYDEAFIIYMNELDLATKCLSAGYKVLFRSDITATHTGVGDTNACNTRAYYFIRNYNTVLARNFRSLAGRLKIVTLQTLTNAGYFGERILFRDYCSRFHIFKFIYYVILAYIRGIIVCFIHHSAHKSQWWIPSFETTMTNTFKHGIIDRMNKFRRNNLD